MSFKCASVICAAFVVIAASSVAAQTDAAKKSSVGTWKLDLQQSDLGPGAKPKSVTLTILEDTPQHGSWRVDVVDDQGRSSSYSWTGPVDGSLHPIKAADGSAIGKESLKKDGDALVRHGEDMADGSSFDARSTMSADGMTITDVLTTKSKGGDISKTTMVSHRVSAKRTSK